jgi:hypothetical protein
VRVGAAGFRPWESTDLHLSPGDSLEVEARLEVGAQTERMEVTAERKMVRTDQGAREGLITSQQIQNLSIISRGRWSCSVPRGRSLVPGDGRLQRGPTT